MIVMPFFNFWGLSLNAQPNYSRVKVLLDKNHNIEQVSRLGIAVDHGLYRKNAYFISDLSKYEIKELKDNGFDYQIIIEDVQSFYVNRNKNANKNTFKNNTQQQENGNCTLLKPDSVFYKTPEHFYLGNVGGFFDYNQMINNLDSMALLYPDLISIKQTIGDLKTKEGRSIYWLRISDKPNVDETDEPEVLYTALHHAREPLSMMQMIFYMWYLLENYETNSDIKYMVNNTEMYFVPCVNPDGYVYNQLSNPYGGGMWRKNKADNDTNNLFEPEFDGVDLNRNYAYKWGIDDQGSSPNPTTETYRGTSGFSEPETQAIKLFSEQHQFLFTLNYHTFSNVLIYPWGYDFNLYTPDSNLFVQCAKLLTKENNYTYGTVNQTLNYVANGDADDWMYGEQDTKNKIFPFTPEVGTLIDGFYPQVNRIIPLCNQSIWQNLLIAMLVHQYATLSETSPLYVNALDFDLNIDITRKGLQENSDYTLSILTNSQYVQNTPVTDVFSTLTPLETNQKSYAIHLLPDIPLGTVIPFTLKLTNSSGVAFTQNIIKVYGTFNLQYTNSANTSNEFQINGTWDLTDEDYVSSPTCITDSPNDNYDSSSEQSLYLNTTFGLTNAKNAMLKFWAKWDIENNYDYLIIYALDNETQNETPLCGKYTNLGTENQPLVQLYDGNSNGWVLEEIDLQNYIGKKINLRFILTSDQFVEGDGFYFDDLQLFTLNNEPNNTQNVPQKNNTIQLFNTVKNTQKPELIYNSPKNFENSNLMIYNELGVLVLQQNLNIKQGKQNILLNVLLKSGVYFAKIVNKNTTSNTAKIIIN